jgi:uncharacterized surface protein with fasciclin (FAS1) repeats
MIRKVGIGLIVVAALVAVWITVARDNDPDAADKDRTETTVAKQLTAAMPAAKVLAVDPQFEVFADLLKRSKVQDELDDGPYTMFIPSSAAFTALGTEQLQALTDDPTGAGADVVRRHIVKGRLRLAELLELKGKTVETISGVKLPVDFAEGAVSVGGIDLAKSDIDAKDSEIHVLDAVIAAPA